VRSAITATAELLVIIIVYRQFS